MYYKKSNFLSFSINALIYQSAKDFKGKHENVVFVHVKILSHFSLPIIKQNSNNYISVITTFMPFWNDCG